jgi:hypothetical protein
MPDTDLEDLHGEPVDLDSIDTRIDPAATGACPTETVAEDAGVQNWTPAAWSAEDVAVVDYPDTGAQPVAHRPWSHALGALTAIAAVTAAVVAVLATGHPATTTTSAPPAAPAVTETDTSTVTESPSTVTQTTEPSTTTEPPTSAAYVAPPFDRALITAADRANFYADLDRSHVTRASHRDALIDAAAACQDLSIVQRTNHTVTRDDLDHEESTMGIDRVDAALIMGAAVRDLPHCW